MTERQMRRRRVVVRGEGDKVRGDGHQVIPPVRFCRQAIQEDRDRGKPVAPPVLSSGISRCSQFANTSGSCRCHSRSGPKAIASYPSSTCRWTVRGHDRRPAERQRIHRGWLVPTATMSAGAVSDRPGEDQRSRMPPRRPARGRRTHTRRNGLGTSPQRAGGSRHPSYRPCTTLPLTRSKGFKLARWKRVFQRITQQGLQKPATLRLLPRETPLQFIAHRHQFIHLRDDAVLFREGR